MPMPYRKRTSPRVPTIAAGADLGATTPIRRPTNSTAPTPSEEPASITLPAAYPKPIAKKPATNGCEFTRAASHSMFFLPAPGDAFCRRVIYEEADSQKPGRQDGNLETICRQCACAVGGTAASLPLP